MYKSKVNKMLKLANKLASEWGAVKTPEQKRTLEWKIEQALKVLEQRQERKKTVSRD